jgi:hypothetical protein
MPTYSAKPLLLLKKFPELTSGFRKNSKSADQVQCKIEKVWTGVLAEW